MAKNSVMYFMDSHYIPLHWHIFASIRAYLYLSGILFFLTKICKIAAVGFYFIYKNIDLLQFQAPQNFSIGFASASIKDKAILELESTFGAI